MSHEVVKPFLCPASDSPVYSKGNRLRISMMPRKFLSWLEKRTPKTRGASTRVGEELGIDQGYAWRLINGKSGGDVSLSTLETITKKLRYEDVWRLVKEIESERPPLIERKVVPIEERYWPDWKALFESNPVRAQRVLMNMRHQEELAYTDLISQIVRLVIDEGPRLAAGKVAGILSDYEEETSAQRTRLRRKLREEYEEIDGSENQA